MHASNYTRACLKYTHAWLKLYTCMPQNTHMHGSNYTRAWLKLHTSLKLWCNVDKRFADFQDVPRQKIIGSKQVENRNIGKQVDR